MKSVYFKIESNYFYMYVVCKLFILEFLIQSIFSKYRLLLAKVKNLLLIII